MPGPAPKPNAVRRNKPEVPWVDLPADWAGKPPALPRAAGLKAHGKDRWRRIWSTPMASQWGEAEAGLAVRLCQLQDDWSLSRDVKVLAEMRHLETSLGLTPKARKELRWRIVDAGAVVEMNGVSVPADRRLRVVDVG